MASLSRGLLEILANIDNSFTAIYRDAIVNNAETLDSINKGVIDASFETRADLVCKASKLLFESSVITSQDPTYASEKRQNWSTTCHLPAHAIILIGNTLQLCLALKLITALQSTFAIRSGGHNCNPGCGSIGKSGVLLDLRRMNQISISPTKELVSVGPGATWADVYKGLEKHELTVAGGRAADVGVGGLILGGGMSHFSNHWGMVCDNVKNFEVVLADSRIVNANAQENSDLFHALKGGGPNFGIVTRFDLYTFPDYKVWYTFKVYGAADSARVLEAAVQVQKAMETDDRVGFFLSVNGGALVAGMIYLGWADSQPLAFSPFDIITPLTVAVPPTNGTAHSVAVAANMPGHAKRVTGTVAVLVDASLYNELFNVYQRIVNSMPVSPSYSLAYTFQPIAAACVQKSEQQGGNPIDISPVSQSWLAIYVQWTEDAEDEVAHSRMKYLISEFQNAAKARNELLEFEFMNDAGYDQNPLKTYGKGNLEKLREVAKRWDPEGIFQRQQNGGFLLSKA